MVYSLKIRILDYLRASKKISREQLKDLCDKNGYEFSNAERRMREICDKYPVIPVDVNGVKVEKEGPGRSRWIAAWKVVPTTKQ